jgi:hypothetical protein
MYNVLEKLRQNEELTPKDRIIHEQGLVSVLKQIHDDLDAAVAAAYGWPADLTDEEILQRLVALNAERAEEEKRGIIRWLRPEFQNPGGAATTQESLALPAAAAPAKSKPAKKPAWPKDLVGQVSSVRALLASAPTPMNPSQVAASFKGARTEKVTELLAALAALGQARQLPDNRFAA